MATLKTANKSLSVKDGSDLIDAAEKLGVPFGCTSGACGTCQIEIIQGAENLTEITDNELEMKLNKNVRLACQCKIKHGEVKIKF